ncbi:MAG: T9SS type A sorting domain-containing protein [Bacteroidia bacterium]
MKKVYLFTIAILFAAQLSAQTKRFKQEVFTDAQIIVDSNLTYGTALNFSPAVMVPLITDIYHADPNVDTLKKRPVLVLLHPGSFLPPSINAGSPSNGGAFFGTRRDSGIVEMARQFAKRGWVVVVGDYRLGWIANSPSANTQKITIMRATYRAVQDSRTLIRYMRKSVDSMANKYRIDPNKIVMSGSNTGATIALHCNSLDEVSDILTPSQLDSIGNPIIDTTTLGGFFDGDHQGYGSRPNLVMSMGGVLADTSILSLNDAPIIAFQGNMDPTAPFNRGVVKTASTLAPIMTVDGGNLYMLAANNKGINAKVVAAGGTGPRAGFYVFYNAGFEPNGWYNKPPLFAPTNLKPRALLYIDTIINYFSPFAIKILDLSTNDPSDLKVENLVGFNMYPNPSKGNLSVELDAQYRIRKVEVYNNLGQNVLTVNTEGSNVDINMEGYPKGIYHLITQTSKGMVRSKFILE